MITRHSLLFAQKGIGLFGMNMTAFALGALVVGSAAQSPVTPAAETLDLAVGRFFETAAHYERTFRNLTVEETRVMEEFDQSSRVRKRRVIVADLVVYRSARSGADGLPQSTGTPGWWMAKRWRSVTSGRST